MVVKLPVISPYSVSGDTEYLQVAVSSVSKDKVAEVVPKVKLPFGFISVRTGPLVLKYLALNPSPGEAI